MFSLINAFVQYGITRMRAGTTVFPSAKYMTSTADLSNNNSDLLSPDTGRCSYGDGDCTKNYGVTPWRDS